MAAILSKKRGHCHGLSFASIFLKLRISEAVLNTRFGIEFQHSKSSTSIKNGGSKKRFFFQNGRQKPEVSKSENKMSRHIDFGPEITKMCIFFCIWSVTSGLLTVKVKNNK